MRVKCNHFVPEKVLRCTFVVDIAHFEPSDLSLAVLTIERGKPSFDSTRTPLLEARMPVITVDRSELDQLRELLQ